MAKMPQHKAAGARPVSFDWPMSREEKKAHLFRLYEQEVRAASRQLALPAPHAASGAANPEVRAASMQPALPIPREASGAANPEVRAATRRPALHAPREATSPTDPE